MAQSGKINYKLDLNAPLSDILSNKNTPKHMNKQLPIAINKLFKTKIKLYFKNIKNSNPKLSPQFIFNKLQTSLKKQKKQQRPSYLFYTVQQLPPQPQVPKTAFFNLRVKQLKQNVFLQLKNHSLKQKNQQLRTILINRQNQLLNHLIPKLEQKILVFGFRKVVEYSKQQKGRFMIIKVLDTISKAIIKRVGYSEFFTKAKKIMSIKGKKQLGTKKLSKIIKLSRKAILQQSIRKIQTYTQSLRLQEIINKKKSLITQVYSKNTQRTSIISQERQALRNLKYKLDQEAVQKSHVLTDKRRHLMMVKNRWNEENKLLIDEKGKTLGEVSKLQSIVTKEGRISERLKQIRQAVLESKKEQISFEHIVSSIYSQFYQSLHQQAEAEQKDGRNLHKASGFTNNNNEIFARLVEIIVKITNQLMREGQRINGVEKRQLVIINVQNIQKRRYYQYRKMEMLELIVKYLQSQSCQMTANGTNLKTSRQKSVRPQNTNPNKQMTSSQYTARTLSQSRLVNNNSVSTIIMNVNSSRVSLNNGNSSNSNDNKGSPLKNKLSCPNLFNSQSGEYVRAREELQLLQEVVKLTVKKRYSLMMKQAISEQLEQLSSLLQTDTKEEKFSD